MKTFLDLEQELNRIPPNYENNLVDALQKGKKILSDILDILEVKEALGTSIVLQRERITSMNANDFLETKSSIIRDIKRKLEDVKNVNLRKKLSDRNMYDSNKPYNAE